MPGELGISHRISCARRDDANGALFAIYDPVFRSGLGIWATPFPHSGGTRWQISPSGGWEPHWSSDGRELFYVSPHDSLVAASVSGTTGLNVRERRALFSVAPYRRFQAHRAYDVRPGNAGFLMIRDGSPVATDLVLVDNWFTELRAKVGKP